MGGLDDGLNVAPSRVRGLKPLTAPAAAVVRASHPHGCVD
ncbi:hypothetical protein HMPREF3039_02741 [Akkermansia sp. KLE1798]|nr:hypothetical protein HMPREF3039_02741 [Akkermansia sp. KLE1798]KZA03734.1 hypothetical protein HMPREF1326_02598 [Akkermansia sp. KLE1605]